MPTTATAAEFDVAFLEGFAQLLATAGVGTWPAAGSYTEAQTGIVIGLLPASPDRLIVLAGYGVDDDPSLSDSVIGLQVTTRWGGQDPREVSRLTARVFDELHGLTETALTGGVHVLDCYRRSHTSIGQDSNSRWRTVQNFYCTVHRPSKHRQ